MAVMVCIAAKAQEMVDFLLGKRKSEGRFCCALRFCNVLDLFGFCRKEGKLLTGRGIQLI